MNRHRRRHLTSNRGVHFAQRRLGDATFESASLPMSAQRRLQLDNKLSHLGVNHFSPLQSPVQSEICCHCSTLGIGLRPQTS